MGKRGPQAKEGSNTALLSIRMPHAVKDEITETLLPNDMRKTLVKAARQKKSRKQKNN